MGVCLPCPLCHAILDGLVVWFGYKWVNRLPVMLSKQTSLCGFPLPSLTHFGPIQSNNDIIWLNWMRSWKLQTSAAAWLLRFCLFFCWWPESDIYPLLHMVTIRRIWASAELSGGKGLVVLYILWGFVFAYPKRGNEWKIIDTFVASPRIISKEMLTWQDNPSIVPRSPLPTSRRFAFVEYEPMERVFVFQFNTIHGTAKIRLLLN